MIRHLHGHTSCLPTHARIALNAAKKLPCMYTAVQGVLMLAGLLAEWATEQLISWPLGPGQPEWHCFRCIQSTCRCAIKQWQKMLTFNKVLPSSDGLGCYIYTAHAARTRLNIVLLPRPKEKMDLLGEASALLHMGSCTACITFTNCAQSNAQTCDMQCGCCLEMGCNKHQETCCAQHLVIRAQIICLSATRRNTVHWLCYSQHTMHKREHVWDWHLWWLHYLCSCIACEALIQLL